MRAVIDGHFVTGRAPPGCGQSPRSYEYLFPYLTSMVVLVATGPSAPPPSVARDGLLGGVELSVNDGANGVHTLIVFSDAGD